MSRVPDNLNYGFVKLALMPGTDLVPQWNFGEARRASWSIMEIHRFKLDLF